MELAPAAARRRQSGSLILAAISAVFTIGHVAAMLGEDEEWLWVYGVGEDGVTAFTQFGIEVLKQIIDDLRAAGKAPPLAKPTE
ncbi:MAG: hypothetical protein H7Y60_02150 [Rhodospirillaceae bacterium]|nr:hypothetical protein [Rhodospirillales bacterium]